MKPTHLGRNSLLAIIAIAAGACTDGREEELRQRMACVENTMLPAVLVIGEEPTPATIWDVLERFSVPGVSVAVINDGVLEWAKGYGVLESGGASVNTETLFLAGHIGQAVATIGALKLVDDGRLGLDATVNDQLSSWRVPKNEFTASETVTLRHLLTHTSGLTVRSLLGYIPGEPVPTTLQILDGIAPAKNDSIRVTVEPGSRQQYSLGGYVVLQQMLEDVTGLPYPDFAASAVLSPLGMDRTNHTQPLSEDLASNAARGYEPTNEQVEGRWRVYPELAAMGMWTTPSDLATLVAELQRAYAGESRLVLTQTLTEEMFAQHTEDRGLGFEVGGEGEWRFFVLPQNPVGFRLCCRLFDSIDEFFGEVGHGDEWLEFAGDFLG